MFKKLFAPINDHLEIKKTTMVFEPEEVQKYMSTDKSGCRISALQLSDSFFPTGMYTTSNGLEALFYSKKIKNANELRDLISLSGTSDRAWLLYCSWKLL